MGLLTVVKPHHVLAIQLSLEVDKTDAIAHWFLLHCGSAESRLGRKQKETNHRDEVDFEVVLAHFLLDIHKGSLRDGLRVDLDTLYCVSDQKLRSNQ